MMLQDCFFVSVVIRRHPELNNKPVAVCHSDNPKGTAEISSANYPAREYGWASRGHINFNYLYSSSGTYFIKFLLLICRSKGWYVC